MKTAKLIVLAILSLAGLALWSQNIAGSGVTPVQADQAKYYLTPISATAAVNNATVLTVPAPPGGIYNYICDLKMHGANDNTATAVTNAAITTTNFNSFAYEYSKPSSASNDTGVMQLVGPYPAGHCIKSASPGTATTFTSASSQTHEKVDFLASYYQAP